MDGTIVIYDKSAYKKKSVDASPAFITKDAHYFRTCRPDPRALEAFRILLKNGCNCGIVTSVWQENLVIQNEQIADKSEWLIEHVGDIGIDFPVVFAGYDKAMAIKTAGLWLDDEPNILIDDYKKNLSQWDRAGGTAVKYLNGINSPWNGRMIKSDMTPHDIAEYLYKLGH